jgi:hypothetical protein
VADRGAVEIGCGGISNRVFFVHHGRVPGDPVDAKSLGNHMRKAALLAAVVLAAAFTTTTTNAAAKKEDPAVAANANTAKLMQAALNPYEATAKAAAKPAGKKVAKKSKKGKKKKA